MAEHPDRLALVTGTSSGVGEAVARQFLARDWQVIGIARREAGFDSPRYSHLQLDLADLAELAGRVEARTAPLIAEPRLARLALVNCAADPAFLGTLDHVDSQAALRAYAVNVVAATWLMGWAMRSCEAGRALRVVNVSSGAARAPFPGMGIYCASKSALLMTGRVLAEECSRPTVSGALSDVAVLSYEPGIVDTPMQAAARTASPEVLPAVGLFRRFAAEGLLVPPAEPAREIVEFCESEGHPPFSEGRYGGPPA